MTGDSARETIDSGIIPESAAAPVANPELRRKLRLSKCDVEFEAVDVADVRRVSFMFFGGE
jgi:hypothetical protein